MRLGLSAAISPGLTVHTATFQKAANDALGRALAKDAGRIEAAWVCDRMCAQGGREAALHLIERGVAAVVGHFSSEAACAAIPIYHKHRVPVILPCSSQDALTSGQRDEFDLNFVFRLSAPDTALMQAVMRLLLQIGPDLGSLAVWSAHGVYAKRLSSVALNVLGRGTGNGFGAKPAAWLLLGHHAEVVEKINMLRRAGTNVPIVIVDDAVDAALHEKIETRYLDAVYGVLASLSQQCSFVAAGARAIPFYRETSLAVEIAVTALSTGQRGAELAKLIGSSVWIGTDGEACFDSAGNNRRVNYEVWKFKDGVFRISDLI